MRQGKIRITNIFLLTVAILVSFYLSSVKADDTKSRVVVSMGDSYSSGEGLAPFYGSNRPGLIDDLSPEFKEWLAHRSKYDSWPGQLVLPGFKKLNVYKTDSTDELKDDGSLYWFFVASSGAKTKDISGYEAKINGKKELVGQEKKFSYLNTAYTKTYTRHIDPQINILYELKDKGIVPDYITLTIGGNDMGFVNIITSAVKSTYITPNGLLKELDKARMELEKDSKFRNDLKQVYTDINEAASIGDKKPCIIVAGYPQLLDVNGKGLPISKIEAALINVSIRDFNKVIEEVVEECKQEMNIEFVDVLPEFMSHEAYTKTPYINKIIPFSRASNEELLMFSVVSARSMHPNKKGADQYAENVQRYINWKEGLVPYPSSTATPTPSPTNTPSPSPTPDPNISINGTNFPDGEFRRLISDKLDPDRDGILAPDEIAGIKEIDTYEEGMDVYRIDDFRGLEFFTELEKLEIAHSDTHRIDISKNMKLDSLTVIEGCFDEVEIRCGQSVLLCEKASSDKEYLAVVSDETIVSRKFADADMSATLLTGEKTGEVKLIGKFWKKYCSIEGKITVIS